MTSACRKARNNTHSHKNRPPLSLNLYGRICPFPNWWFFFQRSDYVCMCLRRLDSVHLLRQRGQKRHPSLLSGRGAVDTNKSPFHFLPGVLGLCQECPEVLLSPGALFLVTHHQAFSAAPPQHTHTQTSTPPGLCAPWSLTLNRPPRVNATDRQASGRQVQRPASCSAARRGTCGPLCSPVGFPRTLCLTGGGEQNKGPSVSGSQCRSV